MQCKATMGAHDVNENNFPYAADHIIGRPDKTFMECHAIKWTLLNQVTGKSEAKQSMNHQCDWNLHMSTGMSGDFNHRKFFDVKSESPGNKHKFSGQKSGADKNWPKNKMVPPGPNCTYFGEDKISWQRVNCSKPNSRSRFISFWDLILNSQFFDLDQGRFFDSDYWLRP
jgi:hypothetical protein